MKIPKLQFPQISRLFSALTLWGLFLALLYANIIAIFQMHDSLSTYVLPILTNPYSSETHMKIASKLWKNGYHNQAKRELVLADDLSANVYYSVLGVWSQQPIKLERDFTYWKEITKQKPDYRDAYIQAGSIATTLGYIKEAEYLFDKSRELDPNFKIIIPSSR